MKIELKKLKYYFLTCDTNGIRKKHMIKEFKNYDITEVNPILNIKKNRSGATGFSKMIDLGLRNQDKTKPFQPFVLFEDDVSKYREFPKYIEILNNTDILYIGLSIYGMNKIKWCNNIYYSEINEDLIRIYNMLTLHGIIICSASGALAIQKCMMEAFFKDKIWDIFTAQIQPYYKVYALKEPLVYQDSEIGGQEKYTKISIKDCSKKDITNNNINTSNISIITCYKK